MSIEWQFFLTPPAAWDAMYHDCRAATASIDCEQFIMRHDDCGLRFASLFMAKARQNVRVRLLCDMVGSYDLYYSSLPDRLRDAGVEVQFYNPVSAWRVNKLLGWSQRHHRKAVLVDSDVAHIGGVCFDQSMASWRDTQVRIRGAVVAEAKRAFAGIWNDVAAPHSDHADRPLAPGETRFVTNAPHVHRNTIYRHFLKAIDAAQRYIYLTTPYYVPDHRFFRKLRSARTRGVDVRLLMPHRGDHPLVQIVGESYQGPALRAGIRVYAYCGPMIHAKTIVIDDRWATVGSSNLDYLSFFGNQEGNLIARDVEFAVELRRQFFQDLENAREVTLQDWQRRPIIDKMIGFAARPIKRFM